MSENLASLSLDERHQKLKSTQAIQRTVGAIFAVIIVAWIVLGYWRTNTPVFISTVAMGVAVLTATSVTPRALRAEIRRRDGAA